MFSNRGVFAPGQPEADEGFKHTAIRAVATAIKKAKKHGKKGGQSEQVPNLRQVSKKKLLCAINFYQDYIQIIHRVLCYRSDSLIRQPAISSSKRESRNQVQGQEDVEEQRRQMRVRALKRTDIDRRERTTTPGKVQRRECTRNQKVRRARSHDSTEDMSGKEHPVNKRHRKD